MSQDYFWPPKFSEKKWTYEGTVNVHLQFMDGLPAPRYIMSIILSSYQHCDEQQFQKLSSALYTFFFSNKTRFNRTSTVTRLHSCHGKKIRVLLAWILLLYRNQYF